MNAVPSFVFLVAALGCSLVGRAMLVGAAFGVGPGWGISVIFVPFAPFFFRISYPELAQRSRYWRLATVPLMLLFFITGGSTSTRGFRLPNPRKIVPAGFAHILPNPPPLAKAPVASIPPTITAVEASAAASKKTEGALAAVADAAPATPTAPTAPTATPAPPTLTATERLEANRRQFEMLAEWYARLKNERGYLLKSDTAGIDAYNIEAAKYQAALQQAKAEQAEVARLIAARK